jgi:hypothetical protein
VNEDISLLEYDSAVHPNHDKTISTSESGAGDSDRTDESESLSIVQDKVSGRAQQEPETCFGKIGWGRKRESKEVNKLR